MKTQDKTGQGAPLDPPPGQARGADHGKGQGRGRGKSKRNTAKGRVLEPALAQEVAHLCKGLAPSPEMLIEHLHRLQDHLGQLPAGHLAALAAHLRLSQAEVFEVASFYHHFECVLEGAAPAAPLTVRVCESISCAMQGADALAQALSASAVLQERGVRIQRVACVGRCAQAPAAVIGMQAVAPASAQDLIQRITEEQAPGTPASGATEIWALPTLAQALANGDYRRVQAAWSGALARERIFEKIELAGLRGMGGAGFPTVRKWRTVAEQTGPRLMAINADEGEPGTFKDRHWFEQAAHRILEGALLAAWTVQVDAVWLYLRDEYAALRGALERLWPELQAWVDAHWQWQDEQAGSGQRREGQDQDSPRRPAPRLHLRRGAGAYVCGEESAMIASIEGLRGLPRLRPPYVAQRGLFGRPTLVNNPETLMWVSRILEEGPQHFAGQGRRGRSGLRSFSVSGRVKQPGVKVAPAGISLRELIEEYCDGMQEGHVLYGFLPGGASGGILPAHLADEPLDFDTLAAHGAFIGSHAIVVLSQHDRASEVARNLMHFFMHESCGQCTPCRAGTVQMARMIAEPEWPVSTLQALGQVMRDASICGLGQAAPNPVDSVLRFFPQEVTGGTR